MVIRVGDTIYRRDGMKGKVTGWHKYGRERHIVFKIDNGEERELNAKDYCKTWADFPWPVSTNANTQG